MAQQLLIALNDPEKKLSLILEFGVYQTQNYNPFECFKLCSFINDASINVILIAVNCSSFHFYLTSMKVTEQITFYLTFYPFLLLFLVLGYYSSRLAGPLPSFRGTAVYFAVTDWSRPQKSLRAQQQFTRHLWVHRHDRNWTFRVSVSTKKLAFVRSPKKERFINSFTFYLKSIKVEGGN